MMVLGTSRDDLKQNELYDGVWSRLILLCSIIYGGVDPIW